MSESSSENHPQMQSSSEAEAFEQHLRSIGLPQASIDTGQLMYQAGWAAAMASLESEKAVELKPTTSIESGGDVVSSIWRTSALVASLAAVVMAVLLFASWQNSTSSLERVAANLSGPNALPGDSDASSKSKSNPARFPEGAGVPSGQAQSLIQQFSGFRSRQLLRLASENETLSTGECLTSSGIYPVAYDLAAIDSELPVDSQINQDRDVPLNIWSTQGRGIRW